MTKTYSDNESLELALNAAAPDGGSWLLGRHVFYEKVMADGNTEQAFYDALDAAAPDTDHWKAGELVLLSHGKLTNHDGASTRFHDTLKRGVDGVKKSGESFRSLVTKRSPKNRKE